MKTRALGLEIKLFRESGLIQYGSTNSWDIDTKNINITNSYQGLTKSEV